MIPQLIAFSAIVRKEFPMRNTKRALSLLPLLLILLLITTAVAFAEGEADAEAPSRF